MKYVRSGVIIAVMTLIFVGIFEVGARAWLWRSPQVPTVKQGFGFSRVGYGDLIPNLNVVEELFPSRPYRLITNSVGLRNTEEVIEDDAVFRVLAIGDSFTYGFYVHNEEAYPYRLEETLEQRLGTPFQVLNAGIPGYTVADALSYMREKGVHLKPDLVILGSYTNDIFDYFPRMREFYAREVFLQYATYPPVIAENNPTLAWLRDNVALYGVIEQFRAQYRTAQIEDQMNRVTPTVPGLQGIYQDITFFNPESPEYSEEYAQLAQDVADLAQLLRDEGVPLVWVSFPDLIQLPEESPYSDSPQRFFKRVADQAGIPFIDLLPVFKDMGGDIQSLYLKYYDSSLPVDPNNPEHDTMMFEGDGHLSMYGNLVSARVIADVLIQEGLVSQTVTP